MDIWPKDKNGNAMKGESIVFNSRNCLSYSPHKLTALIGVENIIVVETGDALLVCHKDQDQKVKNIVNSIKKKGRKEYL